jgi:[citrate (pro-3S)-lyase] ligase
MNEFKQCTDFSQYVELLKNNSRKFVIILVVKDAVALTTTHKKDIFDRICEIGFDVNLNGSFRHSYIGIMDCGELLFEKIAKIEEEPIDYTDALFEIKSQGYKAGNLSSAKINGREYAINNIGLNIIIYDNENNLLIDSVAVNMLHPQIVMRRFCEQKFDIKRFYKMLFELTALGSYYLSSALAKEGYNKIAIFCKTTTPYSGGYSFIDRYFISSVIADHSIEIKYIVTDNETVFENIPNIKISEALKMHDVDVVIVPDPELFNFVLDKLNYDIFQTIIPIKTLWYYLDDIHRYETQGYNQLIEKLVEYNNNGISSYVLRSAHTLSMHNPSEWEKIAQASNGKAGFLKSDVNKYFESSGLSYIYSIDDFKEILYNPVSHIPKKNYFAMKAQTSKFVNVDNNGQRVIDFIPKRYSNTVHILGDSIGATWEMMDCHTLGNQLQQLINEKFDGAFRVLNYCVAASSFCDISNHISDLDFVEGDVIIVIRTRYAFFDNFISNIVENHINFVDLQPYFERPHEYGEVFFDSVHPNPNGYRLITDVIYKLITSLKPSFDKYRYVSYYNSNIKQSLPFETKSAYALETSQSCAFITYINSLKQFTVKIGAIVMNCNPFTLGHRYLIEYAASKVKALFIFAVEEDKSIFPFKDRFELIKQGTSDLENVTILPSGKFIISSLTFSDYFNKSELQDRTIDPSQDVELFAKEIAPTLGITVRFAGEEPLDNVTRQYNDAMARILPQYGVEFEVIPRKESDGEVISASRVRKLLETRDFEAIAKIVPETTLQYLMVKFGSELQKGKQTT